MGGAVVGVVRVGISRMGGARAGGVVVGVVRRAVARMGRVTLPAYNTSANGISWHNQTGLAESDVS